MLGKLVSLKALGIAVPAMALTASGAAAATGSLPAPAQSAVHGALAHVGVSVPSGNDTPTGQGNVDLGGHAAAGLEIRLSPGQSLNLEYRFTAGDGTNARLHTASAALGFHW